jgi:hypothetical protein
MIANMGWAATAERLKAQQPQMPSFWERARHFAMSAGRHAANKLAVASQPAQDFRRAKCNACRFRDQVNDVCLKCGCKLSGAILSKIKWASERCPIGEWEAEDVSSQTVYESIPEAMDDRIAKQDMGVATALPVNPGFFNYNFETVNLRNFYRGRPAVIMGRGPSLANADLDLLKLGDAVTIGLNGSVSLYPLPTAWVCVDDPSQFPGPHWTTQKCLKLVPGAWKDVEIPGAGRVSDMPTTVYFVRNARFRGAQFLTENTFNFGTDKDALDDIGMCCARSVLFVAVKAAFVLGIRKVGLLGVDWKVAGGDTPLYADGTKKSAEEEWFIHDAFRINGLRISRLRPILEAAGMTVQNLTPGSALEAFERSTLEEFVST